MRTFADGEYLWHPMLTALAGHWPTGTAVLSGCAPSGSALALQVTVAAGSVIVSGTSVAVGGNTLTLDAADATLDRYDLITVNSSGTAVATAGTPSESPACPAIPANSVVIAVVEVDAAQTTVPSTKVYDARLTPTAVIAALLYADHIAEATSGHTIVCNHLLDVSTAGVKNAMTDQTGSRALNTSYQNTTDGQRVVTVGLDGTGSGYFQAWISANGSDWTIVGGGANGVYKVGCCFVVPVDYYYKVTATAATLDAWWEMG